MLFFKSCMKCLYSSPKTVIRDLSLKIYRARSGSFTFTLFGDLAIYHTEDAWKAWNGHLGLKAIALMEQLGSRRQDLEPPSTHAKASASTHLHNYW